MPQNSEKRVPLSREDDPWVWLPLISFLLSWQPLMSTPFTAIAPKIVSLPYQRIYNHKTHIPQWISTNLRIFVNMEGNTMKEPLCRPPRAISTNDWIIWEWWQACARKLDWQPTWIGSQVRGNRRSVWEPQR